MRLVLSLIAAICNSSCSTAVSSNYRICRMSFLISCSISCLRSFPCIMILHPVFADLPVRPLHPSCYTFSFINNEVSQICHTPGIKNACPFGQAAFKHRFMRFSLFFFRIMPPVYHICTKITMESRNLIFRFFLDYIGVYAGFLYTDSPSGFRRVAAAQPYWFIYPLSGAPAGRVPSRRYV